MLESRPLYHQVAERIHALIRSGTLRAGDKVPSVRRLSRQQGVSISTVLQAYLRLEDGGIIEARPQSGYYVRPPRTALPEPQASRPPQRALAVDVNRLAEAVLAAAQDPKVVSFGAACDSGELFPAERLRRALAARARREPGVLTRYSLPPGAEPLRRAVARRALDWGCRFDHRNLITTNGAMEAINLCLRAVTRPGDLVALESPTFFGFLQVLETLGLRALEIPTHPRSGLSLEALQLALAEHPVKAVLAMPTVSNPLGATMPDAAKKRLVEMLAARGVPLIEDNLYGDLHFAAAPPRAAKSFDREGGVMLLSSFTKTLAPGLRVGWIEAGRWREALCMLKFAASAGQSGVEELAVADLLESGGYDRFLRGLRRRFESHLAAARAAIAASFPQGTRVSGPSGGFILWVELPRGADSVALFERCLARGVSIAPGPMFSASGRYRNCLRLGVGRTWTPQVEDALRTVGRLAQQSRS